MNVNTDIFKLKKPCANCPFRKGQGAIELREGRREQIINDLVRGVSPVFHCHKTVYANKDNFNENGDYTPQTAQVCPGAVGVLAQLDSEMVLVQVSERLGYVKPGHYRDASKHSMDKSELDLSKVTDFRTGRRVAPSSQPQEGYDNE